MKSTQYKNYVVGEYSIYLIDESTNRWSLKPIINKKNTILYSWGFIAAQCIGLGDTSFKINAAYLEYKNLVNPGDAVTIPTYERSADISYFNGLPSDQDFLRVPLTGSPTIDIEPGFEDYFIENFSGNRVTFVAQSTGTQGVLGREFSDTINSKIFGITLVATPLFPDRTQDVILARSYFDVNDQILKAPGSQIGIRWKIAFN